MALRTKQRNKKVEAAPVCWWCKIDIGLIVEYVAFDSVLDFPPGVGIRVCTPACPERPETATVINRKGN